MTKEIWETTTKGRVWVEIGADAQSGRRKQATAGGRVGARLRIDSDDRLLAQEGIVHAENDPFTNGLLIRVDADQQADESTRSDSALSDEDLLKVFKLTPAKFQTRVAKFSETTLRRMSDVAEVLDASASQIRYLKELIEERHAVGGDTPTYRELKGSPSVPA